MGKVTAIDGVLIKELQQFADARGSVLHMLRVDDPLFVRFGEIYFSEILPGVVKAWKQHLEMTQLFAVPVGAIRLVIYDDRPDSPSRRELVVLELGRENYCLVRIPPRVWYGFQCLGDRPALLANCADMPHQPGEARNLDPAYNIIPYSWEIQG